MELEFREDLEGNGENDRKVVGLFELIRDNHIKFIEPSLVPENIWYRIEEAPTNGILGKWRSVWLPMANSGWFRKNGKLWESQNWID